MGVKQQQQQRTTLEDEALQYGRKEFAPRGAILAFKSCIRQKGGKNENVRVILPECIPIHLNSTKFHSFAHNRCLVAQCVSWSRAGLLSWRFRLIAAGGESFSVVNRVLLHPAVIMTSLSS